MSLVSGYPSASYGPTDAFCPSGFYPQNHPSSQVSDYNNQQQHFYSSTWAWNPQSMAQNPGDFNNCYNSSCNSSPCHYGVDYAMTGPSSSSGNSAGSNDYSPLGEPGYGVPRIRVVKRRTTANKKERRRTQSINNAFTELRDCIPNVPADTKLSKIKTLRLATSYISYLMSVLEAGDADVPFRAELGRPSKCEQQQRVAAEQMATEIHISQNQYKEKVKEEVVVPHPTASSSSAAEKRKGRTGWPHHVWALELKP